MSESFDVPALDKIEKRLFVPATGSESKPTEIAPGVTVDPSPVEDLLAEIAAKETAPSADKPPTLSDKGYSLDAPSAAAVAETTAEASSTATATSTPAAAPTYDKKTTTWSPGTPLTAEATADPSESEPVTDVFPLVNMSVAEWSAIVGFDTYTSSVGLRKAAYGTPSLVSTVNDDGDAILRYSIASSNSLDISGTALPHPSSVKKIDYFFPDVARNLALVRRFSSAHRLVLGVSNNARFSRVNVENPLYCDNRNFVYWMWNAYIGRLFGERQQSSSMTPIHDYDEKVESIEKNTIRRVTPVVDYGDIEFASIFDGKNLPNDDRDTVEKTESDTPAPTASELALREAPIARPNGELYFPRRVTSTDKSVRFDVEVIRDARENKIPVLFYGPPGTGKSAMAEAALSDVITIPGTADTETADFIGSYVQLPDGTYEWVDGPLLEAMEGGRPLFIDEIALIDSRVLAVVYSVMDGRDEIRVTANPKRGTVKAAPGFYVLGACNPDVPGAVMSEALLSRFKLQIEVTTDFDTLETRLGVDPEIIIVAKNLYKLAQEGEISNPPQTRELLAYQSNKRVFGRDMAISNLISSADPNDREAYIRIVSSAFDIKATPLKI